VKSGAGRDIEDLVLAGRLEGLNEEAALALGAGLPVDQLIPLVDE
jgi:hypothetical protein